jgi:5-methylthioadenosine/S-adenosylhomocysteine deaminase
MVLEHALTAAQDCDILAGGAGQLGRQFQIVRRWPTATDFIPMRGRGCNLGGDLMSTLLIEGGAVLTQDAQGQVYEPGYVVVEDDRIRAVGPGQPPDRDRLASEADGVIDATRMAVMPGLVNAHSHLFQTFVRGLADDKPLLQWLETAIWPVMHAVTEEEMYLASLLGLVENVRSGATSVIDNLYIHTNPGNADAVFRAAKEVGTRLMLARGWADMNYHEAFMEKPDRIISETERIMDTWHGAANGRLRVQLGPVIPWGCSDETMKRTYALAQEWGVGTHIHTAESKPEVDMVLEQRGLRHVEWLEAIGCLGPSTQLVHSVWLSDEEIELIARRDAIIVHCPVSNMYLASGIAPITKLRQMGVSVALATDGPGSNNSQDMMEVLKFTACLQKVGTLDAMSVLPEDVLDMAARGGARAMGLEQEIGSLEVGKKADITLVDLNASHIMPVHRVPSALVYNANGGDVDTVIVNGRVLMRDKQVLFLDEEALLEECRAANGRLFERAGIEIPS